MAAEYVYDEFYSPEIGIYYSLHIYDYDNEIVNLELPSSYNGKPVKEVVYWPTGVSNIKTIKIPDTYTFVSSAGEYALGNLEKVYYQSVELFFQLDTREFGRFPYNVYFSFNPEDETIPIDVDVPAGIETIVEYKFEGIKNVRSVSSSHILRIEINAFHNCTALEEIFFPNLTEMGMEYREGYPFEPVFEDCPNISRVQLCDIHSVEGDRLSTIYLGNFNGTHSVPIRFILPSGTDEIINRRYSPISSALIEVYSGKQRDQAPITFTRFDTYPILHTYGGEEPRGGEWYFGVNGKSVFIKGEDAIEANISFTIGQMKSEETLAAKYGNIASYQTNKYYKAGTFDFMVRGSIGSSDTQPIKGNIMHLRSLEIKYFDDSIHIDHDDLVVIDGHLYGVEELSYDIKRSPKPYTVYFATLNNIK